MKRHHAQIQMIPLASLIALVTACSAVLAAESTEPFDAGPILKHNRAWLHPELKQLKSVAFTHAMEPIRDGERFVWRRDGASLVELLDSQHGADRVGQRWVSTSGQRYYYIAPQSKYAQAKPLPDEGLDRYFRNHLMGTRANFVAVDWGWNPEGFAIRKVRRQPDGRIVAPVVPTRTGYRMNAGAMFHASSSAYVHDIAVGWAELSIDPATRRILREVDYSPDGKVECEIEFLDWHSAGGEGEVPLWVRLRFARRDRFEVDYRFQWRHEGLWILKSSTAQFQGKPAQREQIVELTTNQPVPVLDEALAQIERGQEKLQARSERPSEITLTGVHRFELGKWGVLPKSATEKSPPVQRARFTLNTGERFPEMQRYADLVAEIGLTRAAQALSTEDQVLLTLLDASGHPLRAVRTPLAAGAKANLVAGKTADGPLLTVNLGWSWLWTDVRHWTLTWLSPGRPPWSLRGPVAMKVPAYPFRPNESMAVYVPSGTLGTSQEGGASIRSFALKPEAGGVRGRVEILSEAQQRGLWVPVGMALVEQNGTIVSADSAEVNMIVREGTISHEQGLILPLGNSQPKHVLFGLKSVVTSQPMGSSWGSFMRTDPPYAFEQLLGAEEPRVWQYGVKLLEAEVRRVEYRGFRHYDPDEKDQRVEILKPHVESLRRLLRARDYPEALAVAARLAGYSGDARLRDELARLLDHPQPEVQDGAAIGLGLLGDARGLGRLRPILARLLPEEDDHEKRRRAESSQTDAATALSRIGTQEAVRILGDVVLEKLGQIHEKKTDRGTTTVGPQKLVEVVLQLLGRKRDPLVRDCFLRVLQSGKVGESFSRFILPYFARLEDKDAMRRIFVEGIRRGDANFMAHAPRDPVVAEAMIELGRKSDLDASAFWTFTRYFWSSGEPKALECMRRAFDEKRYQDKENVRQELIATLARHGDYRGLPELFERLVKASDDSTLPKDAKAREQEAWKRNRIVWDLARSTIPGQFPTAVLAEFLRPRVQSNDLAVRQAAERIFEFSRPVEIAVKSPPPRLPESVVRLSHVADVGKDKQSYGGTGFGVRFTRPDHATHVVAVQLYCSRYGEPMAPDEDFHIYLLDENQKAAKDLRYPYAQVERGNEQWYTFPVRPAQVPKQFFVGLWFNAHQTKGIFVGKDTAVQESHSYTGTPEKGYKSVKEKHDWMVRVCLAPAAKAEELAAQFSAKPAGPAVPEPLLASPDEQAKGREILRKLREANRVWLVRPVEGIRNYAYEFHLGDRAATKFEVAAETAGRAERQGITYGSVIHHLIQSPDRVAFRQVQTNGERVILSYLLAEPVHVAIGNGIRGTWSGYFSMGVREGTLVVDAKRLVPLEHKAEKLHEAYSHYVDVGQGHFAPLRVDVDHGGMKFAWTFHVYDPGLWLLASARYGAGQADGKAVAWIEKVHVNGTEAKPKHSPTP